MGIFRLHFSLAKHGHSMVWTHTHRIWTFDSDRDVKWTIPTTMALYIIGGIGSTACYYIGTVAWSFDERIVFLVNSSLWGFLNYLGQREIAFKEVNTSHPSETE